MSLFDSSLRRAYVCVQLTFLVEPCTQPSITVEMKKSAHRDANTARCLCRRGPSSISVPNLKRIALFVQKLLGASQNFETGSRDPDQAHLGVVLYSIRRRDPSPISWAPARGEQGGQAPTLEKIRVGMAHSGNFSRGLKTSCNSLSMKV